MSKMNRSALALAFRQADKAHTVARAAKGPDAHDHAIELLRKRNAALVVLRAFDGIAVTGALLSA